MLPLDCFNYVINSVIALLLFLFPIIRKYLELGLLTNEYGYEFLKYS